MARLVLPLAAAAALLAIAHAGVTFSQPAAGATLTAGTAIQVSWSESSTGPKLADLESYQLFLMAGGNADGSNMQLASITTQGSFAVGSVASGLIGTGIGANTPKNAYFLKMQAVGKQGGTYIAYSDRFSYSGMTGSFPANAQLTAGLATVSGTAGPADVDNTVKSGGNTAVVAGDDAFEVEYVMQTGLTRFAPMQPVPPTQITKGKPASPLFPTSSVQIATTRLPIPSIVTTVTQSQTFSVSSRENTIAAAAHPTDDMQKFLNRWKD
ncbi:Cell wall synthesis protein kre9 precursor [Pleosporales sp. CAS-2024a]